MDHLKFGNAELFRIEEMIDDTFVAQTFIPKFDLAALEEHKDWMIPDYYNPATGNISLSIHSWLIKTDRHTVLVDTCIGNHKDRMPRTHWHELNTPYLDRIRAAGTAPEDIDYVMCTHLHPDHVGWNTKLEDGRWVPTFPNAKYIFGRQEYDHWMANPDAGRVRRLSIEDSVLPIVEAGQAVMVDDGHQIDDAFKVELCPGHSPGHVDFRLDSGREPGYFTGDALHHPCQVYHPEWSTSACIDPVLSGQSRRALLERICGSGGLMLPVHFLAPHVGYVREQGDGFRFEWFDGE